MPDRPESDLLFQVDLARFVPERNALAKGLKSEGQHEEAARIAKLRRPAATVWALNQVARAEPGQIDTMLDAGSKLRAAMERTLGGDPSDLRAARAAEIRAVDDVVNAASERLLTGGHSATEAARQRMAATLRAAIVDEAVAAQLSSGTLDVDREAPGFGLDALSFPTAPTPSRSPDAHGGGDEAAERLQPERARQAELMAEADRLAGRAARLEADAMQAERRAADARAFADKTATEALAARGKADHAAAEALAARTRAEEDGANS